MIMNKKIIGSALAIALVGGGIATISQVNASPAPPATSQVQADNQKDGKVPDAVEKAAAPATVAVAPKAAVQIKATSAVDDQKDGEVPDSQEKPGQ
jgi:hypothetical protein